MPPTERIKSAACRWEKHAKWPVTATCWPRNRSIESILDSCAYPDFFFLFDGAFAGASSDGAFFGARGFFAASSGALSCGGNAASGGADTIGSGARTSFGGEATVGGAV